MFTLTPEQRRQLLAAAQQAIPTTTPASGEQPAQPPPGMATIEDHLDALADIAQRIDTELEEAYLAAVLEDICAQCAMQYASGYCALRHLDACALYRHARPVVQAIARTLREQGVIPPQPTPPETPTWLSAGNQPTP